MANEIKRRTAKKNGLPELLESDEQQILFEWAAHIPDLRWMYAVPNGEYRTKATAVKLKRQGVKKGVSDICLPLPRKGYHGMYIELKRSKSGKPTPEQKQFLSYASENGYYAVLCHGWKEAKREIEKYIYL